MKYILAAFFFIFTGHVAAQSEQVFTVKKPQKANKDDYQRLFNLNITPGKDTLETYSMFEIDFAKIFTYYDSIAAYNAEINVNPNHIARITITAGRWGGHSILKFYKKQKDHSYKLVYIKNWVIIGKKD